MSAAWFKTGDERELTREGVRPRLSINKELGTAYSTLLLTEKGERTVLVYRGAANDLTYQEVPLKKLSPTWVYITPGNIPFETILRLATHFHTQGARIAINPSSGYLKKGMEKLQPLFDLMDVIIMNREEASALMGVPYKDEQQIFEVLDEAVGGIAVMTEGPKGVVVSNGETLFRAGIFEGDDVRDRTGAGDAFGSGFVSGLARKDELSDEAIVYAIRLASANATSVVEHIGAKEGILSDSGLH